MNKFLITISILVGGIVSGFSQTQLELDSKRIINKAIKLHDDKKYEEAITEFKKVNSNDTNFVYASAELVNTYITAGKDSLALLLCDRASTIPSAYSPTFLLYKANAMDNLKRSDEAMKLYEEGMKKYPQNHSFFYEAGVLKIRQEKFKEAHDFFVKSIKINPYHESSHYQMIMLAIKQGKIIPTMLAMQFYLLLDNSSERAKLIVGELEKIARNEYEFKDALKIEGLSDQDDFSELEALVRSKVATTTKYKSEIKLNFNVNKQLQLVFEKMQVVKSDKGFYMQFYAPMIVATYKEGYFAPFMYNILGGMGNDEVSAWLKKNKPTLDKYVSWAVAYITKNYCTYECMLNGKMQSAAHYYQNSRVSAVGEQSSPGVNKGYWNYFYPSGIMKSEGSHDENGKRNGIWKFYFPSGLLSDIENYQNGIIEGKVEEYYSNGSIKIAKNYMKGQLDGMQTVYYATGGKQKSLEFKAGKQDGKEILYHSNGKLNYEVDVVNGLYEGKLTKYYDNGHLKETGQMKENFRSGKTLTYYNYPEKKLMSEETYEKGIDVGEYKTYYRNGKLKSTGTFAKDGKRTGLWTDYNDNGDMSSEENYNAGKLDGMSKNYDDNNVLSETFLYKNGILQEYKAFDEKGEIVFQNKKDGKNNYDVNLFYSNGNKRVEGRVEGGEINGEWKKYNRNGYLSSLENYKKGKLDGKSYVYYDNGKVKSETDYIEGETNGLYKKFYKNGQLNMEGAYIKDNEIGEWKTYYQNGKLQAINYYLDGKIEGWQQYYNVAGKLDYENFLELDYLKADVLYDSLGNIIHKIDFDKGSAKYDIKYPNGKQKIIKEFVKNELQGAAKEFYPNGQPISEKYFENGSPEGEFKFYYPSGKIEWIDTFTDGKRNGTHKNFYDGGGLKRVMHYDFGDRTGKDIDYFPNGKVERDLDFKDNKVHGKSVIYAETGELAISRNFVHGYLISYTYEDKNGQLVPPILLKNETGNVKSYYKNGSVALEYQLKNGAIEGKRVLYYPNGKVQEEDTYLNDERNGVSKEFYASGKIKLEVTYILDEANGKAMGYYEDGKVKSEENFVFGKKQGPCYYYDPTGKLIATLIYYYDDLIDGK